MGFYVDRILPHITNLALSGQEIGRVRRRVSSRLSGDVLEVGFGSGLNIPHYPAAVRRVLAVEPASQGRVLARNRLAASPVPVDFVGLDGQYLPLDSSSVDHILVTWTLCTIPDPARALGEMRRVLRPGGALHFVEHGRAPDQQVAEWQDRLTPLQRRLFGGCHLNRPIPDLIAGAGFEMQHLDRYYLKGPKPFGYMYEGVAVPS
ncbi:MAG: class I SAM-dependent methyltransferase [Actinomycetota bacterium]|nr:class I SAM-dependent methyltransferase [Actinomycetota bacterium]